jgi:hypothetical protein
MGATGTTGYVAVDTDANLVIVAFRGTESFTNLIGANIPSIQKDQVPHTICPAGCGMGARGFLKSWTDVSAKVIKTVNDTLAATGNTRFKIVAAGHSLGAATATFATLELRQKFPSTRVDLVSLHQPRLLT